MGSCILNETRSQFCGGRKPECPEETLEVRLRSTETRSTYNSVVEVESVIDVDYASLTSQGVQHRVFYRDGHPSRYQPHPTGLNFGEQTGTGVFPLVIVVPRNRGDSNVSFPVGLSCITEHESFPAVSLNREVWWTALVSLHDQERAGLLHREQVPTR